MLGSCAAIDPAAAAAPEQCGDVRVLMFSGLVRRDLIDKALMSGAWGYVVKSDGQLGLLQAMRAVVKGEFALSRSAKLVYSRG